MASGITRRIGTCGPWILTGSLWIASAVACFRHPLPGIRGLLDVATGVASFWCIARHYSPPPKPGHRVISDEEFHATEQAITRGVMAGLPEPGQPGRRSFRSAAI